MTCPDKLSVLATALQDIAQGDRASARDRITGGLPL